MEEAFFVIRCIFFSDSCTIKCNCESAVTIINHAYANLIAISHKWVALCCCVNITQQYFHCVVSWDIACNKTNLSCAESWNLKWIILEVVFPHYFHTTIAAFTFAADCALNKGVVETICAVSIFDFYIFVAKYSFISKYELDFLILVNRMVNTN